MTRALLVAPSAEKRVAEAAAWLAAREEHRVLVVSASLEGAANVARRALAASSRGASIGWHRAPLGSLAVEIAREELAARGLVPVSNLALEAVCARVVHERHTGAVGGGLGRFAPIGALPGLPRALARTLTELRLARRVPTDPDLAHLLAAFEAELDAAGLADRARVFEIAESIEKSARASEPRALVLVDAAVRTRAERDFVHALVGHSSAVLAVVPSGDDRTIERLESALEVRARHVGPVERNASGEAVPPALARLHTSLFGEAAERGAEGAGDGEGAVVVLSAPGESRECVEIARLVLAAAAEGTPFDRMAVLLRAPQYAAHLDEAFRRAKVPSYFARGTRKPDPTGRAMLALVACAAEGLSAARFGEYLSLGEVPDEDASGAPPAAAPETDRIAVDEETLEALLGDAAARAGAEIATTDREDSTETRDAEEDRAVAAGTLRAPRHWERLLVDSAVIGGRDRWVRRLGGLEAKLTDDLAAYVAKGEDHLAEGSRRDLAALATLRGFALPIVMDLAALPSAAPWQGWLDALSALATRALRHPERVLAVLQELRPMDRVGPVGITEVRLVLEQRLSQLLVRPEGRRYGKVFVATIDEARGLDFDVVFVPGLAEKLFPQKVVEDPLLLDEARAQLGADLPTNEERTADERLALRLAVGAASRRVVLSYPRLDVEQARPRTPSFYGLEVLRVEGGELRDFEHLAERAARRVDARIGWPAPTKREEAIDEAEYDLALLESILERSEADSVGEAHYLLGANEHLARALRFRGRRWLRAWKASDGLVDPPPEALAAIHEHALDKRSFSPTALQNFAACPYRFLLSAVHRLAPRQELAPIEDLDPLARGSLVHEIQYVLLTRLRERELLPVTRPRLDEARAVLDEVLAEVTAIEHDRLAPAIERVWQDAVFGIAADLREWLRLMIDEPSWTPAHFELSFGLKDRRAQDAISDDEPAKLDVGIKLRGSIDLVEKSDLGALRATDHKTGRVRAKQGETLIGKGEVLQPVLYALTLEKLFPGTKVESGRLYYCTAAGNFTKVDIPLDDEARASAALVAKTVGDAVGSGFLPAAPAKDACKYCDYRPVCGPYEEIRTKRKPRDRLEALTTLRRQR